MVDKKSMEQRQIDTEIEVLQVQAVTPHNRAIYEAGKMMLIDTLKIGRDFCQFMITTSIGAISVYLALLLFLFPKDYSLGLLRGALVAGPAIFFFGSALLFVFGYFPYVSRLSLESIDNIEKVLEENIKRRNRLAIGGLCIFTVAILYAIAVVILNIGTR